MDRSRRTTHRRRHLGASASPTSASEASFDFNPSSPVVAHTNTTPQSAGGRRSTKPLQHAFTFSPPGNSRGLNRGKRSTTMDSYPVPDEDGHGPKKGGHSLRKRARVDYTFEHIDDDVIVPNSTSSARGRKRRSEAANYTIDDFYGTDARRRGTSMGADTPSTRRRNPSRKSSEMKAYHEAALEDDDNDVQDTIEVGAYYSDADESEFREPSGSNHSSPRSNKMSPKNEQHAAPQTNDGHQSNPPAENTTAAPQVEQNKVAQEPPPAVKPIDVPVSEPAEPQPEQLPKVEPEAEVVNAPQTPTTAKPIDAAPSVPVPVPATPAEDRQTDASLHSPTADNSVNGATEARASEATVRDNSYNPDSLINNMIKEESNHQPTQPDQPSQPTQPTVEKPSASPKPPSESHHEDKMDVDPVEQPELPQLPAPQDQDVEMTDAAPAPTEKPAPIEDPTPITKSMPIEKHMLIEEPALTAEPAPIEEPVPIEEPAYTPSSAPIQEIPENPITSPKKDENDDPAPAPLEATGASIEPKKIEEPTQPTEPATDNNDNVENNVENNGNQLPDSPQIPPTKDEPNTVSSPPEIKAPTPSLPADTVETPASSAPSETKSSPQKPITPRPAMAFKPQPTPVGRWAHLTPYVEGEYILYPEKKGRSEDDAATDEPTPEGKDTDREIIDMEPMVEDNDDNADATAPEAPTPALNTPTRGSPVPDSADPTTFNSPAPGGDDADDVDVSESQEPPERRRYFRYRKLRDPEEYISAIENSEDMSTEDLFEILDAINVSMVQWQQEWTGLGKIVDDYENSLRRRAADAKYEARTRNLHQHGVNYEEPDFAVKGYKAREKEGMSETRYLQGQDRIMAATYGFEYDPHPSKIGKQNPETQQVGIMTRGRSLRNQPRQTAKATETEEVTGKRQRKPVQLFDPATQDVSRSSTPVPTRGRRRKNANADDDAQTNLSVSFNNDVTSDGETTAPKTRRKRGPRGKAAVPNIIEDLAATPDAEESAANEELTKPTRRGRGRPAVKYEEADPNEFVDEEPQEEKPPVRRHLLTLKIPKGKHFSEPVSALTDNGESRPSTASSEESSHTAESSYSFRPKRQKRFRDDPDEAEESAQAPPKKRGKRASNITGTNEALTAAPTPLPPAEPAQAPNNRKVQKIKVVRSGPDSKNGTAAAASAAAATAPTTTPAAEEGEEPQKDYKSMTKSEKMSASMKNRWANGNMAGAVEKRKATLAAKKAAQAAAEQRLGVVAPKPKGKAAAKREAALKLQMQQQQIQEQQQQQQMMQQPQPIHPHQHQHQHPVQHQHGHPQHPLHIQQQPPMHQPHPQHAPPPPPPPHQAGNPPFLHGHGHTHGHGMPGMGYPYQ
ncbi:hypothetical protein FDECE_17823 [Fusarium decemcellulare]|nr:hypothetical protein FDECE_17823 [Fusarium decemcellulare]